MDSRSVLPVNVAWGPYLSGLILFGISLVLASIAWRVTNALARDPAPPKGQGWERWFLPRLMIAALPVLAGAAYGLFLRASFGGDSWIKAIQFVALSAMTIGFLFGVPYVIGALTVILSDRRRAESRTYSILMPCASVLLALAAMSVLAYEGLICLVIASPLFLLMAVGGGLSARAFWLKSSGRTPRISLAGLMLLPYALATGESYLPSPDDQIRTVHNEIVIEASPEAVWREIKSVPVIKREELPTRFSHLIGFPRPLEATLSDERLGGERIATFEKGLAFSEIVNVWKPQEALGFAIRVEPIPADALDEHVAIGGPFFDVLDGLYEIQPISESKVKLLLTSRHRLSTRFNFYSGFWSELVMHDVQSAIMQVLKARAESPRD